MRSAASLLPPPSSRANRAQATLQRQEVNRAPEEVRPPAGPGGGGGPPSGLALEPGRLWVLQVPLAFSAPRGGRRRVPWVFRHSGLKRLLLGPFRGGQLIT